MEVERFALITNSAASFGTVTVLRDALGYVEKTLNRATDVVIVSAYYGEDFIRKILATTKATGRRRTLTFVFAGLPDVAPEHKWTI
jgi:hypothetical protein